MQQLWQSLQKKKKIPGKNSCESEKKLPMLKQKTHTCVKIKLLVNRHLPKRAFSCQRRKAERKPVVSSPPRSRSTSSLQHWWVQLVQQLCPSVKLQMKSRSRWLQAGTWLHALSPTQGSHIHHQVPACGRLHVAENSKLLNVGFKWRGGASCFSGPLDLPLSRPCISSCTCALQSWSGSS